MFSNYVSVLFSNYMCFVHNYFSVLFIYVSFLFRNYVSVIAFLYLNSHTKLDMLYIFFNCNVCGGGVLYLGTL